MYVLVPKNITCEIWVFPQTYDVYVFGAKKYTCET